MAQKKVNQSAEDLQNPTAKSPLDTDSFDGLSELNGDEPMTVMTPEVEAAIIENPDDPKVQQARKDALVKRSATIGKRTYEFPFNDVEDVRVALYLAQYFTKDNLMDGQVFTYNFHRSEMLICNDLGVELNLDNPTFTYNGTTFHDF